MASAAATASPLKMFIVVRKDLLKLLADIEWDIKLQTLNWPVGSVISQGCHAAVTAITTFKDDPAVHEYTSVENISMMHKVVFEVKGEPQLVSLSEELTAAGIKHVCWREQPENMLTALATLPYTKEHIGTAFKKCSLFR